MANEQTSEETANKRLTLLIDPILFRRVRVAAAVRDMSLSEFGAAAIEAYLVEIESETAEFLVAIDENPQN